MESGKRQSAGLLVIALLLAGFIHWVSMPQRVSSLSQANDRREELAISYVGAQEVPDFDFQKWDKELKLRLENDPTNHIQGEAIAILYGLENRREDVEYVVGKMPGYDPTLLYYALGYADQLPSGWKDQLTDDWFGTQLEVMIYQRLGDDAAAARTMIRQRHIESQAGKTFRVHAMFYVLRFLGMGLLISMFISHRQFRRLGRSFFPLPPLFFPMDVLQRFFAWFLVSYVGVFFVVGKLMSGQPFWLVHVVSYLLQMCIGLYLMKRIVFPKPTPGMFAVLGLENLTMQFYNVFQIVGGVLILLACNAVGQLIATAVGWPYDRVSMSDHYGQIMSSPLAGGIYLLVACIVAPAFEEIVFRGLLLRGLLSVLKPWQALTCSALLFAMLHPMAVWPFGFTMGFGLGLIYYRSANLLVSIWAHALWNCSMLLLALMGVML